MVRKYDTRTCKARTANALRIENYYGDLDEIYEKDNCVSLLADFTGYSTKNNANNVTVKQSTFLFISIFI